MVRWSTSADRTFGANSALFVIDNNTGNYSVGGSTEIKVGDQVELIEKFTGDTIEWKRFFGQVEQRAIVNRLGDRTVTLNCLDFIAVLRKLDIDYEAEGTRVEIQNENLKPNFLPDPNSMFSQIFDFRNNGIAIDPAPILMIRDKLHQTDDVQFDGFDVLYDVGQVKFGAPLNARDNHDVIARSYWFYTQGLHAEDIIESILTQADGYGKFLFGETSAQAVIDNHLKTTFQDEDGEGIRDTLTANVTSSTITIEHSVASAITELQSTVVLDSIEGIPSSGTGTINGDTFTWANIVAHTKTLTGVPTSGANALTDHPVNSIFKYENTYDIGQVWYLTYSNVTSTLTSGDFSLDGGVFAHFDARNGRVILQEPISITASVKCDSNYEFKTLQATGIELNKISFRSRELETRFDALSKVKSYLAPNYILRTLGDNKIWANYLSQRVTADYTLDLMENINYLEDEDLFTRVIFYGKNKNPTNAMFDENVDFSETGQTFKSFASNNGLSFKETVDGHHIFQSLISDAGYIVSDFFTPKVFINGIPIDNELHRMVQMPVRFELRTRTETHVESSKFGGTDVTTRTFYFYRLFFGHQNIDPSQSILLYNANGTQIMSISPGDGSMDYGRGIYNVPGDQQNSTIESIAAGTYWVRYSTSALQIDHDNVEFKIHSTILPDPSNANVTADYEYYTVFTPQTGVGAIFDGRFDTQVQTEFFSDPPSGFPYAIIDLGQSRTIQAIDVIAGFYKPDEFRKFDVDMRISLQSSTDNVTYRDISESTNNIQLTGGESASFEEQDLGIAFTTRYLKIVLEKVQKLDFGGGLYPVAFTEMSVYEDIVIKSASNLIATTALTSSVSAGSTTIDVTSTANFTEPDSGDTDTAYIGTSGDSFTYSGLTATSFTGTSVGSGITGASADKVYQSLETDSTLYDNDDLLTQLGDRVFKQNKVSDQTLFTQSQLDILAKAWLKEFYKDHTKISVNVLYAPYLKVGQTVAVTDSYNNLSAVNYFIEKISENSGAYNLTLARFP